MKNKLTFIKLDGYKQVPSGNKRKMALFRCECGKVKRICLSMVKRNKTKSCGCININQAKELGLKKGKDKGTYKHGMFGTRFYGIYRSLKDRCDSPKNISYRFYGKIGIKNEWKSFEDFYNDMYKSYVKHVDTFGEKETTIERIDSSKNYSKNNCRWATYKEQGCNRKNNLLLEINGQIKHLSEWSRILNKSHFITKRIGKIVKKHPVKGA